MIEDSSSRFLGGVCCSILGAGGVRVALARPPKCVLGKKQGGVGGWAAQGRHLALFPSFSRPNGLLPAAQRNLTRLLFMPFSMQVFRAAEAHNFRVWVSKNQTHVDLRESAVIVILAV
jgi:hypothetical protein